jgi:hypothetical protein
MANMASKDAGYSGTPLAKKLGIKPARRCCSSGRRADGNRRSALCPTTSSYAEARSRRPT